MRVTEISGTHIVEDRKDDDHSDDDNASVGEDHQEESSTRSSCWYNLMERYSPMCRSSIYSTGSGTSRSSSRNPSWWPSVLNPRAKWIQEWNLVFLLVCTTGLFVDPLFFYALSISETCMCLFVDGWFAITVTALRCMTDALHVWNMWLQFRMPRNYSRRSSSTSSTLTNDEDEEDDEVRVDDHNKPSMIGFFKAQKGFFLDLFVILPLPQIIVWVIVPSLLRRGSTTEVMTVLLIIFLFQYIPKIYHSVRSLRRAHNFFGYIFGTVWWGIALNMIAYFVAAHAAGACWYLLGLQRATKCLKEQCSGTEGCGPRTLACARPIYYGETLVVQGKAALAWAENSRVRFMCIDSPDNYAYGAYSWTVQLVTNDSRLEKILFPIFWGLMTLSTFGNLQSTTEWLEVVFLNATTSKKQGMHLKMRSMERWMKRRKLPPAYRQRVRQYERQRWAATRGVDESQIVSNLPEGLRRDIKYHLCLGLVRQVPLFQHMDELVLENICDRVKSLIFPKGETITREGDPVQRMLFVVRGHLQSSQVLRDGVESCCMLGPGNFSGDELLSWCLRRPFIERLPPSSFTLVTLETTEAFGLEAEDVKYVTQHFRYTFVNEKVRRSARYYSPGWRTWAAVAIQLAWRRYRHRLTLTSLSFIRPRRPLSRCSSLGEDRLRLYTALLTSPKPHQDDEFSF
ncbi:hypothetical protein Sjap_003571 [Stephania japonica]|uniref:Cyclic nucleotide-binding domain-containing protein n=1 Tax=Stephania japonica TaxID=461633 RepID=A0AAP0KP63_9MAGN